VGTEDKVTDALDEVAPTARSPGRERGEVLALEVGAADQRPDIDRRAATGD